MMHCAADRSGEVQMAGQPGFFDRDRRYAALSAAGDPLERLGLAIDFELYLVDEITAVGDKAFRKKCRDAFTERRERAGLLMVSHEVTTLAEYCKRCIVLFDGSAQIYDSLAEATAAYEEKEAA